MARATWKGAISFGLVSVPVQLFTAVRHHSVHFRQLHEGTNARVERKRVDAETGDEVPYDEIIKGYEVGDARYVVIDPDELAALDPEASRTIDIRDFVDGAEIDPLYYDRGYYLLPDGEAAVKPYRLLTAAMRERNRVAIAKFVMRNKEYLAAIRARDDLLLLSTMNYADEVADPADVRGDLLDTDVELQERELDMAGRLVDSLTTGFDPTAYHDEYQDRVMELIEAKANGEEIEVAAPESEPGGVIDLMAALEQSLQRSVGGGGTGGSSGAGADADELAGLTRDELYERAQQHDVPGRSSMTKDELIAALLAAPEGDSDSAVA